MKVNFVWQGPFNSYHFKKIGFKKGDKAKLGKRSSLQIFLIFTKLNTLTFDKVSNVVALSPVQETLELVIDEGRVLQLVLGVQALRGTAHLTHSTLA